MVSQKVSTFFFLTGMYCTENIGKQSKSKQEKENPKSVYFDLFLEKYFSTNSRFLKVIFYWSIVDA